MATHKRWRKTYFSTPSTIAHQAYPFWTGERRNRRRTKDDRVEIDVSHDALKDGALGAGRIWRHIVTIDDAEAAGCDLFDIDELRVEYAPDEFANLLCASSSTTACRCSRSTTDQRAAVDSLVELDATSIPMRRAPVRRAARSGSAMIRRTARTATTPRWSIVAPPLGRAASSACSRGTSCAGSTSRQQADFVKAMLTRYNCTYLGIDATGVGAASTSWSPSPTAASRASPRSSIRSR